MPQKAYHCIHQGHTFELLSKVRLLDIEIDVGCPTVDCYDFYTSGNISSNLC